LRSAMAALASCEVGFATGALAVGLGEEQAQSAPARPRVKKIKQSLFIIQVR
jgi:hypothetical protein